ncbi:hypothetical protein RA210_U10396 [Rubrivivax sp. A210]|nr:hypothetical protein RA210_U10396 [Rubrivivax sp. A210]
MQGHEAAGRVNHCVAHTVGAEWRGFLPDRQLRSDLCHVTARKTPPGFCESGGCKDLIGFARLELCLSAPGDVKHPCVGWCVPNLHWRRKCSFPFPVRCPDRRERRAREGQGSRRGLREGARDDDLYPGNQARPAGTGVAHDDQARRHAGRGRRPHRDPDQGALKH